MSNFQGQNDKFVIIDKADHPVVTNPVAPQAAFVAGERLTPISRVIKARRFVQIIEDPRSDLLVKLSKLL